MLRTLQAHLSSRQVSRVVYGAIIGLALVVALEDHPPSPAAVAVTLLGTAVAVALAELYSEILGTETRLRRRVVAGELRAMADDVLAVAFGVVFPAVFFVLAAAGAIAEQSAFTIAKWSGVGLIGFYGFCASRLAGENLRASGLRALAASLVGGILIGLKALVH